MNRTIKHINSIDFEVLNPPYFETKQDALNFLENQKKMVSKNFRFKSMHFEPNFKVITFLEKFLKTFDTTVRIIAASHDFLILQPFLKSPIIIYLANVSSIEIILDIEKQSFSALTTS
jgi:hypothetical protein